VIYLVWWFAFEDVCCSPGQGGQCSFSLVGVDDPNVPDR